MAALPYIIEVENRRDFLYVCVEAETISFEIVVEYTNEIIRNIRSTGHRRVLLATKTPVLKSTDCYMIASYILRNAVSNTVKIAVVDISPENAEGQSRISGISRTAGLNLKAFKSVRDGERWLMDDPPKNVSTQPREQAK